MQLLIVKYFQRYFSLPIFIFAHWFLTFYILYFYVIFMFMAHFAVFSFFFPFFFCKSKTFFDGAF